MNKADFIKTLGEKTGKSENDCIVINSILEDHFIVGKKNKEKIVADFAEKLSLSDEEADELYNTCASLIVEGALRREQ